MRTGSATESFGAMAIRELAEAVHVGPLQRWELLDTNPQEFTGFGGKRGLDYEDCYWEFYRYYYKDPFPHSLLSTRERTSLSCMSALEHLPGSQRGLTNMDYVSQEGAGSRFPQILDSLVVSREKGNITPIKWYSTYVYMYMPLSPTSPSKSTQEKLLCTGNPGPSLGCPSGSGFHLISTISICSCYPYIPIWSFQ